MEKELKEFELKVRKALVDACLDYNKIVSECDDDFDIKMYNQGAVAINNVYYDIFGSDVDDDELCKSAEED